MTKLTQFFTAAGTISLSQEAIKMVQALRAGAKPAEAARQSGLTLRQVQRLSAMPQVRELVATTAPLMPLRISRRVFRAFELIADKGATEQEAARAAGIKQHHLHKELARPDVRDWFHAKIIDDLRAAVPRARARLLELRAKRRGRPEISQDEEPESDE
jgi:hypothetical protein